MPLIVMPGQAQRVAVAVAVPQDQTVEEYKRERLFPIFWDGALVFRQSEEGAAAQANMGRVLQELHAVLAGWPLIIFLGAGDERDCADVDFRQSLRPLIFLCGGPAFAHEGSGIKLLCATCWLIAVGLMDARNSRQASCLGVVDQDITKSEEATQMQPRKPPNRGDLRSTPPKPAAAAATTRVACKSERWEQYTLLVMRRDLVHDFAADTPRPGSVDIAEAQHSTMRFLPLMTGRRRTFLLP